jgi:probable rRNA maturation factor
MSVETFSLTNRTKAKLPRLAFALMKDAVLGKKYSLELNIVNEKTIQAINKETRGKNEPTDILSFPLSDTEGEMYINIPCTKKEAKKFGRTYENFLAFLFIHGLVHLKGFDHGSTMERIEAKFRKKFGI